jgi:hypothetical protein
MECATSFKVTFVRESFGDFAVEQPVASVDKIRIINSNVVNFNFFIIYLIVFYYHMSGIKLCDKVVAFCYTRKANIKGLEKGRIYGSL